MNSSGDPNGPNVLSCTFVERKEKKSKYGWSRPTNYHNTNFRRVAVVVVVVAYNATII